MSIGSSFTSSARNVTFYEESLVGQGVLQPNRGSLQFSTDRVGDLEPLTEEGLDDVAIAHGAADIVEEIRPVLESCQDPM